MNSDVDKTYYAQQQQEMGVSWRSFWCGDKGTGGAIPTKWGVTGWPTIYIMDHKGVIRFKNLRNEKMEEAVMQLLEEMQADKK